MNMTYERDGKWYTLQEVDSSTKVERLATPDEIPAALAKVEKPAPTAKPAKPVKKKAK